MLYFSCDLCGCQLHEERFVVKMEVYAPFDPEEFDESDLEEDNLQLVAEELDAMELSGETELDDGGTRTLRYDLCPQCRKKFLRDPLGRKSSRRMFFSEN